MSLDIYSRKAATNALQNAPGGPFKSRSSKFADEIRGNKDGASTSDSSMSPPTLTR
eukprot:CAMPEP_0177785674 /NCGR_PEP_ID=MMETSP0491_2-20121128/20479_1 /TAXON_ID=63592 /ORGANISM="Tetraselmis chuii, Strain PLY429" /LENGTH=55 /DNA_ID=CAMNT_0019306761 /DNA_START=32 /DNA_END=199 /DNA_ORIENTATION=-